MVQRSVNFLITVIFSDEPIFTLFSDNRRVWVWILCSQRFDLKRMQTTIKRGSLFVMVWGAIWSDSH